jgi:hypothetical protein
MKLKCKYILHLSDNLSMIKSFAIFHARSTKVASEMNANRLSCVATSP